MAIGVKQQNDKYFFQVSDFNYFNPTKPDNFKLTRYGLGYGGMQIGTAAGMHGVASNGIMLGKPTPIFLGIEPFSGEISAYTDRSWNNNYMYQPAIDIGVQTNAYGLTITGLLKAGIVVTNYFETQGVDAEYYQMTGGAIYLTVPKGLGFGYDISHFNNIDKKIIDFSFLNKLHFNYEEKANDKSLSIGYRFDI